MANEIACQINVTVRTGDIDEEVITVDLSDVGAEYVGEEFLIGTSDNTIQIGGTPACIFIANVDSFGPSGSTNTVLVDSVSTYDSFPQTILPGQAIYLKPETGTIHIKAVTAPCKIFLVTTGSFIHVPSITQVGFTGVLSLGGAKTSVPPPPPYVQDFAATLSLHHRMTSVPPSVGVLKTVVPAFSSYPNNEAYLRKDFAEVSSFWVQSEIAFDAASLNTFLTNGGCGSADLITCRDDINDTLEFFVYLDSGHYWFLRCGNEVTADLPVPVDSVWKLYELHYVQGGVCSFYIDGSLVATVSDSVGGPPAGIQIGQFRACNDPLDDIVYYRNIKVGTTRGGTQIFADDFSTSDFSLWDSVVNDCTLVSNPF